MRSSGRSYDPDVPAARQLLGRTLEKGWRVIEKLDRNEKATGGHFSVSYIVQDDQKRRAFLKALDYSEAFLDPAVDPARQLEKITAPFNFERDLHDKCKSSGLSRIVGVRGHGTIRLVPGNPAAVVQYLVFELAPHGDIRAYLNGKTSRLMSWTLQMMHQSAAALRQLHSIGVAHQDLKPSNLLIFSPDLAKLADLGRAFDRNAPAPHDDCDHAGDPTYAPPELLYGYVPTDWRARRLGCDLYLLGSLFVFLWAGVSMTHMLFARLDPKFHYLAWGDTYEEVLPYIRRAFLEVLQAIQEASPSPIAQDVTRAVSQLCDPDPARRGHPRNRATLGNVYSLERYVAMFDRLSKRAALLERLRNKR